MLIIGSASNIVSEARETLSHVSFYWLQRDTKSVMMKTNKRELQRWRRERTHHQRVFFVVFFSNFPLKFAQQMIFNALVNSQSMFSVHGITRVVS